jgi:TonB family protein
MILAMTAAIALAAQTGEARPPQRARANLNQYFSADDYPETALIRRAEGTTYFRLQVDAEGAITNCTVTRSSGNAALDAATCSVLLGRARYEPARDSSGRAVAGKDEGRVTWRLPPRPPPPPLVLTRTVSRLQSDGNGLLICAVLENGVPLPDVGPSRCGVLAGTGAEYALRSAPAASSVAMVWVVGPADAAVEAPVAGETALGTRGYDLVATFDIDRDGRVAACRTTRRDVMPTATRVEPPDLCAPRPPGNELIFAPSDDPTPRHAKARLTLYLEGWSLDVLTGNAATPARPNP